MPITPSPVIPERIMRVRSSVRRIVDLLQFDQIRLPDQTYASCRIVITRTGFGYAQSQNRRVRTMRLSYRCCQRHRRAWCYTVRMQDNVQMVTARIHVRYSLSDDYASPFRSESAVTEIRLIQYNDSSVQTSEYAQVVGAHVCHSLLCWLLVCYQRFASSCWTGDSCLLHQDCTTVIGIGCLMMLVTLACTVSLAGWVRLQHFASVVAGLVPEIGDCCMG